MDLLKVLLEKPLPLKYSLGTFAFGVLVGLAIHLV
jgi:hypothetical protein